jgi:hypothetical protein
VVDLGSVPPLPAQEEAQPEWNQTTETVA